VSAYLWHEADPVWWLNSDSSDRRTEATVVAKVGAVVEITVKDRWGTYLVFPDELTQREVAA
jgi:hypothetical protein